MANSNREFKESNINYLNKDFDSFKSNLIEYAKTYFPNSYKDFNETSPGMMLIEMSAYVGDVLSFYIDQQYKEMMLPLAQERRNITNIAKMLGYKVKPTIPAYVELTITQDVESNNDINDRKPDYTSAVILDKGLQIQSSEDSNIIFETLEPVDFTVSSSLDPVPVSSETDANGIISKYQLTRKVLAISGETRTKDFTIGSPQQYLNLTLPEENVIDIVKVEDLNNGNRYYEVDYLAQDKVPIETFYVGDSTRASAYHDSSENILSVAVPYTLQYIKTGKRFITEVNDDNTTSLVFGNGVLRRGAGTLETEFANLADAFVVTPGDPDSNNLDISLDPRQGDSRMTLGETPGNTTLRVTYRVGGGIASNVSAGSLVDATNTAAKYLTNQTTAINVINDSPAYGGNDEETIEEIRHKSKQFFASQNRCVTKEDFEARVLNIPPRFGSIAKVFAKRTGVDRVGSSINEIFNELDSDDVPGFNTNDIDDIISKIQSNDNNEISTAVSLLTDFGNRYQQHIDNIGTNALATIDIFALGYDNNKNLVTLPSTDSIAHPLKQNIKEYLNNFRMITDQINIRDGKIINFGVAFEVVAHRSANKGDVKLRCIDKITEYFDIDKMQFRQPIYTSDLEYELMGLEGVRSVNFLQLTQDFHNLYDESLDGLPADLPQLWNFNVGSPDEGIGQDGYGFLYPFADFYNPTGDGYVSRGVILPSVEPSVFELKKPRENIRGVVI
tara:strand:+ start:4634 stop:6820 length:2187 start_codon:yes stop_codon:yes gene_type:complete